MPNDRIAEVNQAIADVIAEQGREALAEPVLWEQVTCVDVRDCTLVDIEEASPDASDFRMRVREKLIARGWDHETLVVATSW